jgi:phosphate-selective porin OprO/OprP
VRPGTQKAQQIMSDEIISKLGIVIPHSRRDLAGVQFSEAIGRANFPPIRRSVMRHSRMPRRTARAAVVLTSLLVASPHSAHAEEASLAPDPVAPAPVAPGPVAPALGARGFGFVSQDGADALAIHWLVQSDYATFLTDKPPGVTSRDTFTIGFAGLQLDAQLASMFHAAVLVDFSQSRLTLLDAFIDTRFAKEFMVRIGKFPTPLNEERLTSRILLPWIGTGVASMLIPVRELGAQLLGDLGNGVLQYNAAIVNGSWAGTISDNDPDTSKDVITRVFLHPFKKSGAAPLEKLGIGVGASFGSRSGTPAAPETLVLRTYGNATFFAYPNDGTPTGSVLAKGDVTRLAPHFTYAWGPLAGFADYVHEVDHFGTTAVKSDAFGATASLALTGEDAAPFARISVRRPWNPRLGHFGGVQLVVGGGYVHVSDAAFNPGLAVAAVAMQQATIVGAGINWYLIDRVGILLDYSHATFQSFGGAPMRPAEDSLYSRLEFHM